MNEKRDIIKEPPIRDCPTKGCYSISWKTQTRTITIDFVDNFYPTQKEENNGSGRKHELVSRKTKYRYVCKKCGYEGVWRYRNLMTDVAGRDSQGQEEKP